MQVKRAYPVRGLIYKVYEEAHNQFAKGEKILLKPDIGNSFDKYAVGVHYSYLNNARIGFLPKEENEFYSLFLSQGGEYQAEIYFINEASQNHSLDYLFIKVTLLIRTQTELDLFIKYNEIKQSDDLSIDRWIVKKLRFNKKKYVHSQRGYLIGGVRVIEGWGGLFGSFADFLPSDNFTISGPLITIPVEVKELNNNKYRIVAEFNENEDKYINVNDDFEYEITDIWKLRKKFKYEI